MQLRALLPAVRSYFGRRSLLRRLHRAEAELRAARDEQRCVVLNRIAELHLELGEEAAAVSSYGSAVDAMLLLGHLDAATALCRRLVKRCPSVVRAHGTLGCLLLARGEVREAEYELDCYIQAAMREGSGRLIRERLLMLARAFPDVESRQLLARLLRQVGDFSGAYQVQVTGERHLSAQEQRQLLSSLLRREVHGKRPGRDDLEAPQPWWSEKPEDVELPFLDTSVLRAAQPQPPSGHELPWLEPTLEPAALPVAPESGPVTAPQAPEPVGRRKHAFPPPPHSEGEAALAWALQTPPTPLRGPVDRQLN